MGIMKWQKESTDASNKLNPLASKDKKKEELERLAAEEEGMFNAFMYAVSYGRR